MTPLLHVRPKKGEVCFTVSDVGGGGLISHPWWGGVIRPCTQHHKTFNNMIRQIPRILTVRRYCISVLNTYRMQLETPTYSFLYSAIRPSVFFTAASRRQSVTDAVLTLYRASSSNRFHVSNMFKPWTCAPCAKK